jgi:hypothetical protein
LSLGRRIVDTKEDVAGNGNNNKCLGELSGGKKRFIETKEDTG